MTKLDQKAILRILLEINQRLNSVLADGERLELILVGSAPLILKGILDRVTRDVDMYLERDSKIREVLKGFPVDENAKNVIHICEDFDERLVDMALPLKNISLKMLGPYDIVISKMATRRKKDLDDLVFSGILKDIDFDILETLLKEKLASVVNERLLWYDFNFLKKGKDGDNNV